MSLRVREMCIRDSNEVFVPEVLVAARAMNMGAQLRKPLMACLLYTSRCV